MSFLFNIQGLKDREARVTLDFDEKRVGGALGFEPEIPTHLLPESQLSNTDGAPYM